MADDRMVPRIPVFGIEDAPDRKVRTDAPAREDEWTPKPIGEITSVERREGALEVHGVYTGHFTAEEKAALMPDVVKPMSGEELVQADRMAALHNASLEQLFEAVLHRIDPNPDRGGIAETPARAAKAWRFWCGGHDIDVDGLFKQFDDGAEGYDEMVLVSNIPVHSHCEHHLAGIIGYAHVAYIPNGRVVGLSKLARVVDALSRRLQVQERLTTQVADAIERNLKPKGVGVIIKAAHHCMTTRGVRIHGGMTTTSALRGALKTEDSARAEFMALCAAADKEAR